MPAKMAHRFERDISSGPSLSFLTSSKYFAFGWHFGGVARSGSLSKDMAVWEQVAGLAVASPQAIKLSVSLRQLSHRLP